MRNKRGWIRIVEAVIALLIITGALLIAITGGYLKKDISGQIYDEELAILREVSKNIEMRQSIINIPVVNTPVDWEQFDNINFNFNDLDPTKTINLKDIKVKIESRIPSYLDCEARICILDRTCELLIEERKNIYARSIAITATAQGYDPKQLKLFCWEKT